ncbi:MAG: hypothetical protein J0I84_03675 [Terrimonas sp.]|nr:hypothetical protein [Terrimonas sp.]OJY88151.1 MAG: hypothetical protein BGP13_06265 [Sphingobacteriales bacterium 40-81]
MIEIGQIIKKQSGKVAIILSLISIAIPTVGYYMKKKGKYEIELIPGFNKGFRLTGYDSRYKENHDIGRLQYGEMAEKTDWRIGQWGCTKNLINSVHTKEGNTDVYFDGSKTLKINNDTGGFVLDIDGSKDYTKDRKEGEAWIHFIMEVTSMPVQVKISDINFLDYSLEFNLTKEKNNNIHFNSGLHTALFIWYITLNDRDPASPTYGDYFWFGLPIYDYRYDYSPFFAQQDGGKEDKTDKFVINPKGEDFLNNTVRLNEPQHMQVDVFGMLKNAYELAVSRGFMKNTTFEKLSIASMYIGWELPGNFDVAMKVDKISMKAGIR